MAYAIAEHVICNGYKGVIRDVEQPSELFPSGLYRVALPGGIVPASGSELRPVTASDSFDRFEKLM